MTDNPYKKPPDNPIECPCCRAVTHWESVYDQGWTAGATLVFTIGLLVCLVSAFALLQLAVDRKLLEPPKWNVVHMKP